MSAIACFNCARRFAKMRICAFSCSRSLSSQQVFTISTATREVDALSLASRVRFSSPSNFSSPAAKLPGCCNLKSTCRSRVDCQGRFDIARMASVEDVVMSPALLTEETYLRKFHRCGQLRRQESREILCLLSLRHVM